MRELPNSIMQDMNDAAESFSDKPLMTQRVHNVEEANPGKQEG